MPARVWFISAAAAIVIGALARWNPVGFVVLDGYTGPRLGWTIVVAALLAVAGLTTYLVREQPATAGAAKTVGALTAGVLVLCGWLGTSVTDLLSDVDYRRPIAVSPDGRYEAVVHTRSAGSNGTTKTVRLRTRDGLLSRESRVDLVCTQPEHDYRVEFGQADRLRIFSGTALLLDTTFDGLNVDHIEPRCL